MILVTGAAGKTGRAVIEALAAKRVDTRAFTRNSEHARSLTTLGATEVNIGGFEDPRALVRAAAGAQAVYHICPNVSRDEVANARAVAAAARAQGSNALSITQCCTRRSKRCRTTSRKCAPRRCCLPPTSI